MTIIIGRTDKLSPAHNGISASSQICNFCRKMLDQNNQSNDYIFFSIILLSNHAPSQK